MKNIVPDPESLFRGIFVLVATICAVHLAERNAYSSTGLSRLPLTDGVGTIVVPPDQRVYFLQFGDWDFEPERVATSGGREVSIARGERVVIAPFEKLRAVAWRFPDTPPGTTLRVERALKRDAFWDQIITVDPPWNEVAPEVAVVESGVFGASLPATVRALLSHAIDWRDQEAGLRDPVIPPDLDDEIPWEELEAAALPLDFQKVLLASPHDSSPGFAWQNGQWLTTWPANNLPGVAKEDHWFAPALLVDGKLVQPAPLSAQTSWHTTPDGRTLPIWKLEWSYGSTIVKQEMFSVRVAGADPQVVVNFQLQNAPADARLAVGTGRRPNVHYWDDRSFERTPVPFFTCASGYESDGHVVHDSRGDVVMRSPQKFVWQAVGPTEMMAVFEPDADGRVWLATAQTPDSDWEDDPQGDLYSKWREACAQEWTRRLTRGAQAGLPSVEWMKRIDLWREQVDAITRVHYQGRDRLAYGAYFYQYYFGIEEGWPPMALAYWGDGDEAQRQAEIMLEPENLDKSNVHHQSRNGAAPLVAATVARLTHDRAWLATVAPAMRECAEWTARVRRENEATRSAKTRGLLPPHIYGGDIRDAATSLYATTACWRGMVETADVFTKLGSPELVAEAKEWRAEADALRARLGEVMEAVKVSDASPPFQPLALELPSLDGRNEGPYAALTQTRLGNYWNLFAPSFLELRFAEPAEPAQPNRRIFEFEQQHGGLWAGLPRFYHGLDVAYAIGNIEYLIDRAVSEARFRPQALASLEAFFLHAASRNGATIPEVAGLFPDRLDARAYERLVRESPWNFGMYDAQRYLEGHISFTEPLGAAAGEALLMIRNALVSETRDANGLADGGLLLLPVVPSAWFGEGETIRLENFPTAYGTMSVRVGSHIASRGEIEVRVSFAPFDDASWTPENFRIRLCPPGHASRDVAFDPRREAPLVVKF